MAGKDFDDTYKILLIGDSAVGKSSLLMRFIDNEFSESFIATIGIDFKAKIVNVGGKRIKLQVWDTAGQERFRTITTAYFRSALGIILVYDVTNIGTYDSIKNLYPHDSWAKTVDMHTTDDTVKILLGNKCDLENKRLITTEKGRALGQQLKVAFHETSAKTGHGVNDVFQQLAEKIFELKSNLPSTSDPSTTSNTSVDLNKRSSQKKDETCCGSK